MKTLEKFGTASVFHGAGLAFVPLRQPLREVQDAEVLVRVVCCTICGSDIHTFTGRRRGPTPCILGHEIVGRIEAFGPSAPRVDWTGQPLQAGDRVTWSVAANCGHCFFCEDGLPQKCEHLRKYGHDLWSPENAWSGGLADFVLLDQGTVIVRVPDQVPDALAATANCAVATAAAVLRAGPARVRSLLILGAGFLGLTACAMAREAGVSTIIVCEPDPERRERAMRFGAGVTAAPTDLASAVLEASGGRGVDLVLELSGSRAAVEASLTAARIGGVIVLAGTVLPTPAVALNPEQVVRRLLTIRGIHNYIPQDLVTAIHFLVGPAQRYPFGDLIHATFPMLEVDQAFLVAQEHPGERVAMVPSGEES